MYWPAVPVNPKVIMKVIVLAIGLLALVANVVAESDDLDKLIAEMRKNEGSVDGNKTIDGLALDIVQEGRAAWEDIKEFVKSSIKDEEKSGRASRSLEEDEGIDVAELVNQLEDLYGDRQSRAKDDDNDKRGGGVSGGFGAAIARKPILIPIPGPPGPPGSPGVPGLPGIAGKSPNLKGLKAILLARLAKILLLIKALLALCLGLSGGMYGATLGLVLPLYKKFKKAGVVVPLEEQQPSYGYQQPAYQHQPAGPYNRRNGGAGSFAPMSRSFVQNTQNQVYSALGKGNAKYGRKNH